MTTGTLSGEPPNRTDRSQPIAAVEIAPGVSQLEQRIQQEKEAVRQNFAFLIQAVADRYDSPGSFLEGENRRNFEIHNDEMLDMCIERGMEKGMAVAELRMLEVAAILHDIAKADLNSVAAQRLGLPAKAGEISVLAFISHHELAARDVRPLLEQQPELIDHILGPNHSPADVDAAIQRIETAIRAHMGPHNPPGQNEPGYFMDGILAFGNGALTAIGTEAQIKHPYPEPGDVVAETLLVADMRSLAGIQGRNRIMGLRATDNRFLTEDAQTVQEYSELDIELSLGEAALISAFDSAFCARDMLPNESDREWVDQVIEESKMVEYPYGSDEIVSWQAIRDKRAQYKDKKALAEVEKKSE